jgi:BlaI family penicillinase repressor
VAERKTKLSDAEWVIMNALWQGFPASAREVLERLGPKAGWAYTTIKTMLDRLVEKGIVSVRKRANAGVYEPRLSREEARSSALRSLVDRAFGGTFGSLVQHFVTAERMSKRERERLRALLADEADRGER